MNKEEILAMEAGGELDLLIHQELGLPHPKNLFLPFRYSTDISAAWQVVEKFSESQEHDWHWQIEVSPDNETWIDLSCCICEIRVEEILGATTPEAICKAALLTKLDEIKKMEEEK